MADNEKNTPQEKKQQADQKKETKGASDVRQKAQQVRDVLDTGYKHVKEDLLKTEKSLLTAIYVKVAILVFIIIYMGWVYGHVKAMDAEAVISTAKEQFKAQLPTISMDIARQLKAQAPQTMDQFEKRVMEIIPEIRKNLQNRVLEETGKIADEMEKDIDKIFTEYTEKYAAQIKEKNPDKSEYEQAKMLCDMIRADYKKVAEEAANNLIKEYSQDLGKLHNELVRLRNGKNLSKKEQLQRKLISVWVKLMKIQSKRMNESMSQPPTNPEPSGTTNK